jgi:hypothetical protein
LFFVGKEVEMLEIDISPIMDIQVEVGINDLRTEGQVWDFVGEILLKTFPFFHPILHLDLILCLEWKFLFDFRYEEIK